MHTAYLTVLAACTAALLWLVAWRLLHLRSGPRPTRARLLNEWVWTLIPLALLLALLWSALQRPA